MAHRSHPVFLYGGVSYTGNVNFLRRMCKIRLFRPAFSRTYRPQLQYAQKYVGKENVFDLKKIHFQELSHRLSTPAWIKTGVISSYPPTCPHYPHSGGCRTRFSTKPFPNIRFVESDKVHYFHDKSEKGIDTEIIS